MVILERVVDCPPLLYIALGAIAKLGYAERCYKKCALSVYIYGPKCCDVEQTKKLHCDKMSTGMC